MALVVKDRVKETSTSTGTGNFTLAGAVDGFQSFSAALANGDTTYYAITDAGTGDFEVGLGTYNAGVITRTTILESTNAGAAVNFGAGEKEVFITYPAEKAVYADASGNISVPGLVDGRDLAADGSKLDGIEAGATADQTASEIKTAYESNANTNAFTDAEQSKLAGIEAGADVTDTVNVTAAGALMDSEVTNLAAVKAFDPTDYATAAQGALADSALQSSDIGVSVQGYNANTVIDAAYVHTDNNYTTAEKSKLAGIESGATADQTASEILTAIKTVDGSASGLDADLLDGQDGSYYTGYTDTAAAAKVSKTGDTMTGNLSFGDNDKAIFGAGSDLQIYHTGAHSYIDDQGTGNLYLNSNGSGTIIQGGGTQARFFNGAGVDLWYNNAVKLATTSTGVNVTGSITLSGTVDGRDIAADGTKLDGIEAGATADQTKADIDALGIDAATLGGNNAAYFTSYTDTAVANLVDAAPGTLDTLNELAAALGDDPNFATTVTNNIATKVAKSGDTMTGNLSSTAFIGTSQSTTAPSAEDAKFDGFGVQGNRASNPIYIHNQSSGGVRISSNAGLGTANGVLVTDAGINVTGNIVVSGTVDGRDVAADGAKLDGIEAGATADQTITAGSGLIGGGTGNVTLSHANTSSQASVNNSGGTVIQDVTLDTYGHVTGLVSYNLDGRYYTESEADSRFVNVTGDTMTGNLTIDQGTAGDAILKLRSDTDNNDEADHPSLEFLQDGDLVGYRIGIGATNTDTTVAESGNGLTITNTTNQGYSSFFWSPDNGTNAYRVFHDNYHPNADKLTTARNIALTGAVTGNANFDGSGNISIATTATSDPTLTLSGDASGSATFTNLGNATLNVTVADDSHTHDGRYYTETEADSRFLRTNQSNLQIIPNIGLFTNDGGGNLGIRFNADTGSSTQTSIEDGSAWEFQFNNDSTSGDFVIYRDVSISAAGETITWEEAFRLEGSDTEAYLYGNQMFHDGYHPNADKWTTARTLSLSGDASGSVSWDGSANATLSVAVSNDSHTHNKIVKVSDYSWSASTNGRNFEQGIQTSFVRSADGYPEYGSVVRIHTYGNDGASAELYFPYGASYGGSEMRYRLGLYNNAGWSSWKTVVDTSNIGSYAWTSSNDGSGSGLDADLLDGVQGSSFLRSDQSDTINGSLTITTGTGTGTFGSSNTSWFHMSTDRPSFYMNKGLKAAGDVGVYNQNTYLSGANMYLDGVIYHYGDTDTYMQFHALDQWRVVVGGTERLEVNTGGINVNGAIVATGNITAYSDERLKSNIKTIDNALDKVQNLRGVTYDKDGKAGLGVIAQEVQKVLPEVVQEGEEYLSVAYGNIVGVLIEAIKEQQKQIDELKAKLDV